MEVRDRPGLLGRGSGGRCSVKPRQGWREGGDPSPQSQQSRGGLNETPPAAVKVPERGRRGGQKVRGGGLLGCSPCKVGVNRVEAWGLGPGPAWRWRPGRGSRCWPAPGCLEGLLLVARQGRPSSPMLARPGTSTHQVSTMIMLTMSTMIQTGKMPLPPS